MKEVYQKAMQKKKKYHHELYAMTFGFAVLVLLAVLVDSLVSFAAFIFFPLFVVPYFISMQTMSLQLEEFGFDRRRFNGIKRMATLSSMLRSGFKSLSTVLVAVCINFVATIIIFSIFDFIPQYHEFIQEFIKIIQDGENFYANLEVVAKEYNAQYNFVMYLTQAVSYGLAFGFFVFKMTNNSLYALCKNNASLPSGRNAPVFKDTFEKYKKEYHKMFISKEWYKILLIGVCYIIGAISFYYLKLLNFGIPFATALALIAYCFLVPDIIVVQEQMYIYMFDELSQRNATNMQKMFDDIKDKQILNDEQQEELDKFINNLREKLNQKKDDDDDNDKSDS